MATRTPTEQNHRRPGALASCAVQWVAAGVLASSSWSCEKSGTVPQAPPSESNGQSEQKPRAVGARKQEEEAKPSAEPPPDLFLRGRMYDVTFTTELFRDVAPILDRERLQRPLVSLTRRDGVWMGVDQHAPRLARSRRLAILDLLSEDVELAPGSHWLFAWSVRDDTIFVQTHAFFLDVETAALPLAPGCVVSAPLLTINGRAAAARVEFMVLPLMAGIDRVEYTATGPEFASLAIAPPATTMAMKSPPNGDIELSARCFSGKEEVGGDSQIITVNGDAPDPETAK